MPIHYPCAWAHAKISHTTCNYFGCPIKCRFDGTRLTVEPRICCYKITRSSHKNWKVENLLSKLFRFHSTTGCAEHTFYCAKSKQIVKDENKKKNILCRSDAEHLCVTNQPTLANLNILSACELFFLFFLHSSCTRI